MTSMKDVFGLNHLRMPKYKYGRNGQRTFTVLTPLDSKKSTNWVAKLHYNASVAVSYKDAMRLCISCDRGPELCEGEEIIATRLDDNISQLFMIKQILHQNDEWYLIFE